MPALQWDIFCRVIDNFGDVGVCWRLAKNLAKNLADRGGAVRLVIDDAAPLAFMAPDGCAGVQVLPWPGPLTPGDVVIEAFGCDPPPAFVATMAQAKTPPVWVNLEYLSAESYVERSHQLPSPQRNGLTKWFFYPGFTTRTGGLLREAPLMAQRGAFDRPLWLAGLGLSLQAGERLVSLFCYDNERIADLLHDLSSQPTLLLLTPGPAQEQVAKSLARNAPQAQPAPATPLRTACLPWLTQTGFDHLLWACDLNFVRGEDSLVRALWAGAPFVWQLYPQDDGAHAKKLQAMLDWLQMPADITSVWWAWNGLSDGPWPGLPSLTPWRQRCDERRAALLAQPDLATQLRAFVRTKLAQRP
jgi:uncharacterized repeat protein (TIGR03837 family)